MDDTVARDPADTVRELKEESSKSMRTIVSLTLCRSLLKPGPADRFRVVAFPVITGVVARNGSTTAIPILLST